jgi:endonuclease I
MLVFVGLLWVQMMFCFTPNSAPKYMLSAQSIRALLVQWHPHVPSPTVEHCVPRSHYQKKDKVLGRDMHALMCVPKVLNSKRSNFKLVDANFTDTWAKERPGPSIALRDDKRRLFLTPEVYRGSYARSIGYFVLTYPRYTNLVHSNVLDLELLLQWSCLHPCSYVESKRHEAIAMIQQNQNPFFENPQKAHTDLLELLDGL